MERRIFISSPRNVYLDEDRMRFKSAIIKEIESLGYKAQAFNPEDGGLGLARGISWSAKSAGKIMKRCVGAVLLGFPYWKDCVRTDKTKDANASRVSLVTEYCQFEGALALQNNLPILAILEENVEERLIFLSHGGDSVIKFSPKEMGTWLRSRQFTECLLSWNERIKNRWDVFLGYCSKAKEIAAKIKAQLIEQFPNIKVLDWQKDFIQGDTIIRQIKTAAEICTGAIFLFTGDDIMDQINSPDQLVPRDNVLFEAGYFIHAKGKKRVLIIVEKDTKVLADLGGIIYASLENRNNIAPLKPNLQRFIDENL